VVLVDDQNKFLKPLQDQPILNDMSVEALRTLFRQEGSYVQVEAPPPHSIAAVNVCLGGYCYFSHSRPGGGVLLNC